MAASFCYKSSSHESRWRWRKIIFLAGTMPMFVLVSNRKTCHQIGPRSIFVGFLEEAARSWVAAGEHSPNALSMFRSRSSRRSATSDLRWDTRWDIKWNPFVGDQHYICHRHILTYTDTFLLARQAQGHYVLGRFVPAPPAQSILELV